jgi:hypothetical protein
VNHITFGENRTPACHPGHRLALQSQLSKLVLDIHAEPLRLLVKERTGARRADSVQSKVADPSTTVRGSKKNQLAVLPTHLNYRSLPEARVQPAYSGRLGGYLINERDGEQLRKETTSAAGHRGEADLGRVEAPQ